MGKPGARSSERVGDPRHKHCNFQAPLEGRTSLIVAAVHFRRLQFKGRVAWPADTHSDADTRGVDGMDCIQSAGEAPDGIDEVLMSRS